MSLTDFFTISAIFGAIASVLGWWLKSRLDSSIRHEYDRLLELFKADQRRSEILHAERMEAFKVLSGKLLALRRYCNARSAEYGNRSEFEPRTDALPGSENISLLQHHEQICRAMEERELFLSPAARQAFHDLFVQMGMGFNLEIWLLSGNDPDELSAEELYNLVSERVSGVTEALYNDLGFTEVVATDVPPILSSTGV
jgi:hypothetical protein